MLKNILLAACIIFMTGHAFAQNSITIPAEKPYIQVTGTSETEVVPDELYVSITLKDRMEGRTEITIEEQETQLKAAIKSLGIDLANLTVNDADAAYTRTRRFEKDVVSSKKYQLKVTTADMLGKVFTELDKLNIKEANLVRVDYSKKIELKKQLRIDAIKAAKEKAIYLAEAIGEKIGKPLFIQEQIGSSISLFNSMISNNAYSSGGADDQGNNSLDFRKMKFSASIEVKFEIK